MNYDEAIKSLAKFRGDSFLALNGLENLSDVAAEHLLRGIPSGELSLFLNGVKTLSMPPLKACLILVMVVLTSN